MRQRRGWRRALGEQACPRPSFVGLLTAAQLAAVHSAGHAIEQFALSEPQRLVATLKANSIGATVTAEIANLKDATLSGAEKFEKAVAIATPLVEKYVAGGAGSIVADVEGVARELVQSLYNDTIGAAKAALAAAATPQPAVAA